MVQPIDVCGTTGGSCAPFNTTSTNGVGNPSTAGTPFNPTARTGERNQSEPDRLHRRSGDGTSPPSTGLHDTGNRHHPEAVESTRRRLDVAYKWRRTTRRSTRARNTGPSSRHLHDSSRCSRRSDVTIHCRGQGSAGTIYRVGTDSDFAGTYSVSEFADGQAETVMRRQPFRSTDFLTSHEQSNRQFTTTAPNPNYPISAR